MVALIDFMKHNMEGMLKILGAKSLVDATHEHERLSKAGNLVYAAEHWDELMECWERARVGFEEFYRENSRE